MASLSSKTKSIRARKQSKAGSARKKALEARGSTPAFPIHKGDAKKAKKAAK